MPQSLVRLFYAHIRRYRAGLDDGSTALRDRYRLGARPVAVIMYPLAEVSRVGQRGSSPDK